MLEITGITKKNAEKKPENIGKCEDFEVGKDPEHWTGQKVSMNTLVDHHAGLDSDYLLGRKGMERKLKIRLGRPIGFRTHLPRFFMETPKIGLGP